MPTLRIAGLPTMSPRLEDWGRRAWKLCEMLEEARTLANELSDEMYARPLQSDYARHDEGVCGAKLTAIIDCQLPPLGGDDDAR